LQSGTGVGFFGQSNPCQSPEGAHGSSSSSMGRETPKEGKKRSKNWSQVRLSGQTASPPPELVAEVRWRSQSRMLRLLKSGRLSPKPSSGGEADRSANLLAVQGNIWYKTAV